jgi:hypothetical protein
MASEEQAQETIRKTDADFVGSADMHQERPNLPGCPKDESVEPVGNRGPATLFAKVVGIRR